MAFDIVETINCFFPDLYEQIREIGDYRKKADYELAELIMRAIVGRLNRSSTIARFSNLQNWKQTSRKQTSQVLKTCEVLSESENRAMDLSDSDLIAHGLSDTSVCPFDHPLFCQR